MSSAFSFEPRATRVACLRGDRSYQMACTEWGDAANRRVLICAHGLTRQGRDFDVLAQAMAPHYRVVCPDVLGRGDSDWLENPLGYAIPGYVGDMLALISALQPQELHWVGTSMGGLIGLGLAAMPLSPVRRLVLNDVGPRIEFSSLRRIGQYLGRAQHWAHEDEAADALWAISQGFGPHTRAQWLALTRPQLRPDGDGYKLHYDPAIAHAFGLVTAELAAAGEAALWAAYDQIACPTLLLRGAESDLLSRETAWAMTQRGPRARLVEWAGVGHAPTVVSDEQVQVVKQFLLGA